MKNWLGGSVSPVLMQVDVPILSNSRCETKFSQVKINSKTHVCAGESNNGKDTCQVWYLFCLL